MTTHTLKVHPEYMDSLLDGSKTFEVRRNDRGFQKGDVLRLIEYGTRPDGTALCSPNCTDDYCMRKPRFKTKVVSYVYTGDPRCNGHGGLAQGYVVLGIVDTLSPAAPTADTEESDRG